MLNDTGRVELIFTSDPRLLAGVSGAVNHVAEAAGFSETARAELVAAVEDACQEALKEVANAKENVRLTVEPSVDGVEAVLEFKPAGSAAQNSAAVPPQSRLKLDSVRRETKGDRARIILSKKNSHDT